MWPHPLPFPVYSAPHTHTHTHTHTPHTHTTHTHTHIPHSHTLTHSHTHTHTHKPNSHSVTIFQYGASKKFYRTFDKIRSQQLLSADPILQSAVLGCWLGSEKRKLRPAWYRMSSLIFSLFFSFSPHDPWLNLKIGHDHLQLLTYHSRLTAYPFISQLCNIQLKRCR